MTANLTAEPSTDSSAEPDITYPYYQPGIDPRELRAIGNSRDLGDIRETRPDLIATVAEHGVDPRVSVINVVPDPDGVLRVLVGFSRTAAAVAVRERENPDLTIGVLVHEPGTRAEQLVAQGIENIHRVGFTDDEEIGLYEQLALEGLDADGIAQALSRPIEQVSAGRTIAANPRTRAAMVRLPEADMFTTAQLAEFEDHEKFHQELVDVLTRRPYEFDRAVTRLRRRRALEEAQLAQEERLSGLGYSLIEDEYDPPEGVELLEDLCGGDDPAPLTSAQHTTCPGRAIYVYVDADFDVETVEFCTDFAAHGHRSIAAVNVAAAEQKLRDDGVRIVDPALDTVANVHRLFADDDAEQALTDEEHAACPGHAAYVESWDANAAKVRYVCDDYAAHGHTLLAAAPTVPTERDKAYASGELKRAGHNNKAWLAVKVDRRAWLAEKFAGWRTPSKNKNKTTSKDEFLPPRVHHWLAMAPVLCSEFLAEAAPAHRYACALLGLDEPKGNDRDKNPLVALLNKRTTTEEQKLRIRLAQVIGAGEEHWNRAYTDKSADSSWRKPTPDARFYFDLLVALGYPLEPVEELINNPGADAEQWPHLSTAASAES